MAVLCLVLYVFFTVELQQVNTVLCVFLYISLRRMVGWLIGVEMGGLLLVRWVGGRGHEDFLYKGPEFGSGPLVVS